MSARPCFLVALALAGAGCGGPSGPPAEYACLPAEGCLPPSPDRVTYAVEVLPAPSGANTRQEMQPVRFDDTWASTLTLRPQVMVQGDVRDDQNKATSAWVVATRASGIAGLPPVVRSTSEDLSADPKFRVPLSAGSYRIRFLPLGPAQSRFAPVSQTIEVMAGLPAQIVTLPSKDVASGKINNFIGQGVNGVTVRAIDPATGELTSSVAVSAGLDVNMAPTGLFALALSVEAAASKQVRLVADDGAYVLTRDVAPSMVSELQEPAVSREPDRLQTFTFPIKGQTPAGDVPIAGARVDLATDLTDAESPAHDCASVTCAAFTASTRTDLKGDADALLVPGGSRNRTYHLVVMPEPDSPFAPRAFDVDVTVPGTYPAPALELKPVLGGQVLGPTGAAVSGALVSTQLPADSAGGGAFDNPLPQAITDGDGRFALPMVAGRYDVVVAPPAGVGLSRWSFEGVEAPGEAPVVLRLPKAASVSLNLLGADGKPVSGAEVRLYELTGYPAPRMRARTTTDANGVAHMLLGVASP